METVIQALEKMGRATYREVAARSLAAAMEEYA